MSKDGGGDGGGVGEVIGAVPSVRPTIAVTCTRAIFYFKYIDRLAPQAYWHF